MVGYDKTSPVGVVQYSDGYCLVFSVLSFVVFHVLEGKRRKAASKAAVRAVYGISCECECVVQWESRLRGVLCGVR